MKAYEILMAQLQASKGMLCVGLDTDLNRVPQQFKGKTSGLFEFNKRIIDATADLAVAYKLNFAYYEQYGADGISSLKATFDYIPNGILKIADAKRGDIGITSKAYFRSVIDYFKADSITVNPYMGKDSVEPFLESGDVLVFLLGLTSNPGAMDFEKLICNGKPLYQHVIKTSCEWAEKDRLGYVVGATNSSELREIREFIPDRVLLIPGIGAQGGSIADTIKANAGGPAVINVSRDIIYASAGKDFDVVAREKAMFYKDAFEGI
jgi:orotidine-5'-phosphate decarboxylase